MVMVLGWLGKTLLSIELLTLVVDEGCKLYMFLGTVDRKHPSHTATEQRGQSQQTAHTPGHSRQKASQPPCHRAKGGKVIL